MFRGLKVKNFCFSGDGTKFRKFGLRLYVFMLISEFTSKMRRKHEPIYRKSKPNWVWILYETQIEVYPCKRWFNEIFLSSFFLFILHHSWIYFCKSKQLTSSHRFIMVQYIDAFCVKESRTAHIVCCRALQWRSYVTWWRMSNCSGPPPTKNTRPSKLMWIIYLITWWITHRKSESNKSFFLSTSITVDIYELVHSTCYNTVQ